jgi:hypothetical protein
VLLFPENSSKTEFELNQRDVFWIMLFQASSNPDEAREQNLQNAIKIA